MLCSEINNINFQNQIEFNNINYPKRDILSYNINKNLL